MNGISRPVLLLCYPTCYIKSTLEKAKNYSKKLVNCVKCDSNLEQIESPTVLYVSSIASEELSFIKL